MITLELKGGEGFTTGTEYPQLCIRNDEMHKPSTIYVSPE